MRRRQTLQTAHDPLARIADNGPRCLRAVVLALLATLVLAGSAYADGAGGELPGAGETHEPGGTQGSGEGLEGPAPGQEGSQEAPAGTQETPSSGETPGDGATGGSTEAPGPTETIEKTETAPTGEGTQTPVEQTPVEQTTPVAPGAGAEVTAPPPTPAGEDIGSAQTITVAGEEEASKPAHAAGEETSEGALASTRTPIGVDAGATSQPITSRSDTPGEALTGITGPPTSSPPASSAIGRLEAQPVSPAASKPSEGVRSAVVAAQRDGVLGCELSALGARATDNCAVGWLGAKRLLSSVTLGPVAASLAAVAAAGLQSGDGGHGGSAVGNSPVSPAPGPAPGGAAGAAGGGGASGVGLSTFFTLAGLLLLGAPRAMRRLRLSSRPWRAACFVLIPERPG
jgi:hypothetical protein